MDIHLKTEPYCSNCEKSSLLTKLQKCSRCSLLFYCSRECQKEHFVLHKEDCIDVKRWRSKSAKIMEQIDCSQRGFIDPSLLTREYCLSRFVLYFFRYFLNHNWKTFSSLKMLLKIQSKKVQAGVKMSLKVANTRVQDKSFNFFILILQPGHSFFPNGVLLYSTNINCDQFSAKCNIGENIFCRKAVDFDINDLA